MKKIILSLSFILTFSFLQQLKAQLSFATAINYSVGTNPCATISADFNGDAIADLVVANQTTNDISILIGSGTGTFSAAVNYVVGSSPKSVATGDYNTDGKIDLAVANSGSNDVSILLGNGTGTFSTATTYSAGTGARWVVSADFDGDSDLDLAVANNGSNNVSILLGSGTGSFAPPVNYPVGSTPWALTLADFNGDSKADLAVTNGGSNNVSILLGSGTGTFLPAVNYAVSSNPRGVVTGDFNVDGKTDLAVSNLSFNDASILLGSGTGTFSAAVNYTVGGTFPISVTSADYDIDGFLDLATTNSSTGNVSILRGNGIGTFSAVATYSTATNAFSGASADFNGDGKIDLAVANSGSNNLSILINTSIPLVPNANFLISNPKCVGSPINFTDKSSYSPTSWAWSFPGGTPASSTSQNPIVTYSASGTYSAVLTASNGIGASSSLTQTFVINANPTVFASNSGTITCANPTVALTGGAAGLTYLWSGPGFSGPTTTQNTTANAAGTFTLLVTNTITGCSNNASTTVIQNTIPPSPSASSGGTLTCSTITVGLTGTGGGTYNWSGPGIISGAATANPVVNQPGCYTVVVTAANGCTASAIACVNQNTTTPIATASSSGTLTCSTLTVSLTSGFTAGATYFWSGPGISGSTTTQNTNANALGIYTISITNSGNGCSSSATTAVIQNTVVPFTSASSSGTITCVSSTVNLNSTLPGMSYTWTAPGGSSIISGTNFQNATGSGAGTYSISVLDPINGCSYIGTTSVSQNTVTPSGVNAGINQTLTCVSTSVTLNGSVGTPTNGSVNWTGSTICGSISSLTTSACGPGIYTLTVTDPINGCSSMSTVQVLTDASAPIVSVSGTSTITCTNTSVNVIATTTITPVSYNWSGIGIVSGATTPTATINQPGTYTVLVTNTVNGCSSSSSVNVVMDVTPPNINVTTTSSVICAGETATMTATGATSYSWSPGGQSTNVITISPTTTTNYTVIGTGLNGCTNSVYQTISVNPLPSVSINGVTNICKGSTSLLSALGATSYTWNSGANTTSISVSPTVTTSYSLTGQDVNGCANTSTVVVNIVASKNISGVITSTTGATTGDIILYKYTPGLSQWDSVTTVLFTNSYSFSNIDSALYVVRAIPTATNIQVTYGDSAISWQNATIINHGCTNNTTQNVKLIALENFIIGPGVLTGTIVEADGFGQRMNNTFKPLAPGTPIPGVIVKGGKNPGGNMYVQTTTNASGSYTLSGLPLNIGTEHYFIYIDIPGLDTNGTYHKVIINNDTIHQGLNYTVDSMYINPVGSITYIKNENSLFDNSIIVFPNPAASFVNIKYELIQSANVQIELYDIIGNKLKDIAPLNSLEKNKYNHSVNVSDLGSGVYFIKVKINNSENTIKLILTN